MLYRREKTVVERMFCRALEKDYINYAMVSQTSKKDLSTYYKVSSRSTGLVSLGITNKVNKSLDLTDKTERLFLQNQLLK